MSSLFSCRKFWGIALCFSHFLLAGCGEFESSEEKIADKKILEARAREVHVSGDEVDNSLEEYFTNSNAISVKLRAGQKIEFHKDISPAPVVLDILDEELPGGLRDTVNNCKLNGWVSWKNRGRTFTANVDKAICRYKDNDSKSVEVALKGILYKDITLNKEIMSAVAGHGYTGWVFRYSFFVDESWGMLAVFDGLEDKEDVVRTNKIKAVWGEKFGSWIVSFGLRLKNKQKIEKQDKQHLTKLANKKIQETHLKADSFEPSLVSKIVGAGAIKVKIVGWSDKMMPLPQNKVAEPIVLEFILSDVLKAGKEEKRSRCFANGWVRDISSTANIDIDGLVCAAENGLVRVDVKGKVYEPKSRGKNIEVQTEYYRHGGWEYPYSYIDASKELFIVFDGSDDKEAA